MRATEQQAKKKWNEHVSAESHKIVIDKTE